MAESWGLQVVVGKTINSHQDQFAGDDDFRLHDFQLALNDDNIKAIWCARGGYGTVRIIDEIDFRKFKKHPKWICGFSDITVLHSHLQTLFNTASIHSLMPINVNENTKESDAVESLRKCLFGERIKYQVKSNQLNKPGKAKAEIVGGNLSILFSLAASQSDMDTNGKILLLEDLDEYLYHVDRMMMQLKRSGKLENLDGLIVGGMSEMKDNTIPFGKTAEEIIAEHVKEFDYPVCYNFPSGHQPDNRAVKLGMIAELEVNENDSLFKQ